MTASILMGFKLDSCGATVDETETPPGIPATPSGDGEPDPDVKVVGVTILETCLNEPSFSLRSVDALEGGQCCVRLLDKN